MSSKPGLVIDLVAVLAAVDDGQPCVMTLREGIALPSGPFELRDRSLQAGLRAWVEQQTHHRLGYVEQLYTFADRDRGADRARRVISISYLGLTRRARFDNTADAAWRNWYQFFPWEDRREGEPDCLQREIIPKLRAWAASTRGRALKHARSERLSIAYGLDGLAWNEELILQRYELAYEAGLIEEAARERPRSGSVPATGLAMTGDHRRILATGIARLRAKIKYRPVVFELMPATFTLLQLQQTVEALAGRRVHKPNFRRLMEQQELVEETGQSSSDYLGRPAKLFRFRRAVLAERAVAGTKLPLART